MTLQESLSSASASDLESLRPPVWARGGHLQTLAAHCLRTPKGDVSTFPGARRVEVPVTGGDSMVGFHVPGESGVLVSLFHGLAGDTTADYLRKAALVARERGHGVWAVNHRGCAPGGPVANRPYHSGVFEDVGAAVAMGRELSGGDVQLAVGFSLSGNALALLMGKGSDEFQPDAALCLNAPIDLARCAERISQGLNRIYDVRFVTELRKTVAARRAAGHIGRDEFRIPLLARLRTFDELYTAPEGGFVNANDYYARCSAGPHLAKIERPTVLMTAADDPFIDVTSYREAQVSETVRVHIESTGGHLGYLSGPATPRGDRYWMDYAIGWQLDWLLEAVRRRPSGGEVGSSGS